MPGWGWDPRAKRYRDVETGRFMPRSEVMAWVEESISASSMAADQLVDFVVGGVVSPADFQALFREELKREYIRQYLLGIGGREQMTPRDWGSIGGMLAEQYRFLPGFIEEIAAGTLTPEQIAARARMYVNSAREAYERAHGRNAKAVGMTEELWVVSPALEHCGDCLDYEAMGWQPLGTFPIPGDGSTQCKTNCGCQKLYRNPETGQMF